MKRLLMAGVLLAGVIAAFPVLAAVKEIKESPLKIGIIDTQKIIRESKASKNTWTAFQKDLEAKQAVLDGKGKVVRNLEEELKNADQTAAAARLKDDLTKEVKEFNRLKSDLEEDITKKRQELTQKLLGDIRQVVIGFSKSEGYTLIMENSAVVTSSDSIDITDKIIKLYDDKQK